MTDQDRCPTYAEMYDLVTERDNKRSQDVKDLHGKIDTVKDCMSGIKVEVSQVNTKLDAKLASDDQMNGWLKQVVGNLQDKLNEHDQSINTTQEWQRNTEKQIENHERRLVKVENESIIQRLFNAKTSGIVIAAVFILTTLSVTAIKMLEFFINYVGN